LEQAIARSPGDPRAAYWKYLLCMTLRRTGDFERLAELLDRTLTEPLPDRERALLLMCRGGWHIHRGEFDENLRVIADALRLAEASRDPEAIGMVLLSRAAALRWSSRDLEQALADILRAVRELGTLPQHGLRLRAVATQALLLTTLHRHLEADQVAEAGLVEARERQARLAEFELCEALVSIRSELGRWSEARSIAQRMMRIAIEEGLPAAAVQGRMHAGAMSVLMGDTTEFMRHLRRTLASARKHQRYAEAPILRFRATALRDRGQLRSAERAFRTAAELAVRVGGLYEQRWNAIERGTLLARVGRWRQAAEVWKRGWELQPEIDSPTACLLRLNLARAGLRLESLESAERDAHEVADWLDPRQGEYAKTHLLLLRAELALARSDANAALPLVQEALARFAQLPSPARHAAAAVDCSRLATQRGLDGQLPVHEWLAAAAESFGRLGDRRGREQALASLVDWYRRHSPAAVRMRRDRDLLQVVSRLLDSMSDFEQLTREAMRLAVEQLDAERGVLLLVAGDGEREDDDTLHPVVEFGAVDAETRTHALSYSRDVVQRVRRSGGSLVLRDARTEGDRLSQSMVTLGLRSVLCVPLFVASRLVGAVYLDDTRRAETFGDSERTLLEGFAELLARAIENSRGQERFRRDYEQLFDENLSLRKEASVRYRPHNIIGGSMALQRVMSVVERAAATASTVLITGENGTGKELIARMLHHAGARSLKPFVAVNCGAIPANLLESELFGILSDIATGVKARPGRFFEADGGTLFLDEIGEMPMQQQVALLRVLSVGAVTPVGGGRSTPVDVRVIAATNRDLAKDIEDGRFRQDLWYRLNVIPVELPPLRERRADIPALAQHFVAKFAAQQQREAPEISPPLMAVLMQSEWRGNVRELQNYIERLMAMTAGKVLRPDQLPHDLQKRARSQGRIDRGRTLREMVAELERRQLQEALERHAGNQSEAARELGLTEQSLRYRLRRYALPPKRHFQRTR
ncbi:MAG: sigma 54-interacting transcriptional regulator, partial [Candidatus Eisenbacteria bacterium]